VGYTLEKRRNGRSMIKLGLGREAQLRQHTDQGRVLQGHFFRDLAREGIINDVHSLLLTRRMLLEMRSMM
jgi:hypothetical protein